MWAQEAAGGDVEKLCSMSAKELYMAFESCIEKSGDSLDMSSLGPAWDNRGLTKSSFSLNIPYMCGANTEDIYPEMTSEAREWCAKQPVKSYSYCFARQLPGDNMGAFHSADLWYWFGTMERCWRPFTEEDRKLSELMVSYLTNFAATGDPNGTDGSVPRWEPTSREDDEVMCLDTTGSGMKNISEIFGK